MKLIQKTTHSGADTIKIYALGGEMYGVVHVIEWSEYDSDESLPKYNATARLVALRGFDAFRSDDGIGKSVHDALKIVGMTLEELGYGLGVYRIDSDSGDVVGVGMLEKLAPIIVAAMWRHGAYDTVFDASGNNARKLETSARRAL